MSSTEDQSPDLRHYPRRRGQHLSRFGIVCDGRERIQRIKCDMHPTESIAQLEKPLKTLRNDLKQEPADNIKLMFWQKFKALHGEGFLTVYSGKTKVSKVLGLVKARLMEFETNEALRRQQPSIPSKA